MLDKIKQLMRGAQALREWLGDGTPAVDPELANARAYVCTRCNLNQPGIELIESVAEKVRDQIEIKNKIGIHTLYEDSLHTCSACSCVLKLKVWLQINRIKPDPEDRHKFDPGCWLLSETKDL